MNADPPAEACSAAMAGRWTQIGIRDKRNSGLCAIVLCVVNCWTPVDPLVRAAQFVRRYKLGRCRWFGPKDKRKS